MTIKNRLAKLEKQAGDKDGRLIVAVVHYDDSNLVTVGEETMTMAELEALQTDKDHVIIVRRGE